ncbi:CHD5-domain-containing protein [Periconia macrospinosa]|uniref:CHD5-domain-containing protein n=1 Tax=Periconia macrospinosa TaxID=97972 RepID=A0A2V1DMN0_9PLEO|nr:CHD5-domain-containing protein [Periconia macrospinosa]
MPSLLLVVFILQLLLHIINTVGANAINELARPAPRTSSSAQKAQTLKKEVIRLKRELATTSAQDNFSKWAKLDRQYNKATAEYNKLDSSLRTHQSTFNSTVSTLRWLGTQGLRFILQFWFSKTPMFWMPMGWVPYYVEWILSFSRAPLGSVSINIWGIACASMIALASKALAAVYMLATKKPMPVPKKEEPMAFTAAGEKRSVEQGGGKKEM